MKYVAIAVALLALPQMASAQPVTGTINLTGVVTGRCSVTGGGQAFADTINLGELAGGDGRLKTELTDAAPDAERKFSVVCTTATPRVELSSTRLSSGGTAPPAGYANNIDFTAEVAVQQASGTPPAIVYTTAAALPAATDVQLTAPLASAADNVSLRVYSFNAGGALLIAGSYTSVISITISPS